MTLVAGVDSSTQSCKVVICAADTGAIVRQGSAPHPPGTEIDPAHWEHALHAAITAAGGIDDVVALSVAGQQHGMVCLDDGAGVVRDALLWNDLRSAEAAADLVAELGARDWADSIGSVPVASFTVTKLRWLATHEPANAARTAAVCLPHDWLTWRLAGNPDLALLATDRGDASGTGYWSPQQEAYRLDLLERAFGSQPVVPRVAGPHEPVGATGSGAVLGPGTGDNAAAAFGLGARAGDVIISIGTSGVVSAVCATPSSDATGLVSGFASASGDFLPLACTLNAARVLDAMRTVLQVEPEEFSRLALSVPAGADGLVLIPYLEGERTPNLPDSTGSLHGLRLHTSTPAHLARASVEGMLCGLATALDALRDQAVVVGRVILVGGGARSEAVRAIAPTIFGRPVLVPAAAEYVAIGAARQAAWTLNGGDSPPDWAPAGLQTYEADPVSSVRENYAALAPIPAID